MEKRKLGEQWVEQGFHDNKMHIYKAIELIGKPCQGCCNLGLGGECFWESPKYCRNGCDYIIKDLGILNEEGCLPSDFGVYPEVYEHTLMGIDGYMVKAYTSEPHIGKYAWGNTKQEAIDAWNRR